MDNKQDESAAPKASKEFKIKNPGKNVTVYSVNRKTMFLNHHDSEVEFGDKKIPVATQAQLKEMYDADATYAKFVEPPAGHTAPWDKK